MADKAVKVKCTKKRFMGVDQYGETYHGLIHPRADLMKRLGVKHAETMYTDLKSGGQQTHRIRD